MEAPSDAARRTASAASSRLASTSPRRGATCASAIRYSMARSVAQPGSDPAVGLLGIAAEATIEDAADLRGRRRGRTGGLVVTDVERGARLDVKNKADRTPLEAAMRARQPNDTVIALLKELAR